MEFTLHDPSELDAVMPQILEILRERRFIALHGEMGAGKTTFTRAFCRALGVQEQASSPTFAIVNEYHFQDKEGKTHLIGHFDLYRLKNEQELFDIGFEDLMETYAWRLIEWPELALPYLPAAQTANIYLNFLDQNVRQLIIL